jgi:hypothetical protein
MSKKMRNQDCGSERGRGHVASAGLRGAQVVVLLQTLLRIVANI